MNDICIIGAGFSGAVIAHELAVAGFSCDVFEMRSHVGGNCHTTRDPATGIMVHAYGPHIFHTDNITVWNYLSHFDQLMPFINRVKAIANGQVYSLPINLHTINQFFGKALTPNEAKGFIESLGNSSIAEPRTFEEQALRFLGKELYQTFFRGYTTKQWGIDPTKLPASILKRLPIRFNYDDNYYSSAFQGIPRNGYTCIIERMLDHKNIRVFLNSKISRRDSSSYLHTFYTGPVDAWFNHSEGRLSYRTLDFVEERHEGDYQGNAVINYCDESVQWTRISEHKHFAPWEDRNKTIIFREYSRDCGPNDLPYYPVRLVDDRERLDRYFQLAQGENDVTFAGRLGTYRYLDMDVTIEEALSLSKDFIQKHSC